MTIGLPVSADPQQQNRNYQASGGADGDRNENSGTTVAGRQDNSKSQVNSIIEERTKNPLSNYSSYTYQITLYMISPGAYNAFLETGRTNINAIGSSQTLSSRSINQNEGVFIVAQSGGVNRVQNRAPYLDLDYYIDDLKIHSNLPGPSTGTQSNITEITFKITEPYGFSFITQLKYASETLKQQPSGVLGYNKLRNPIKQFFVLGIRFIGYDANGDVTSGKNLVNNSLAPFSTNELYEQFYDIQIAKLNFRLDGKATTYDISARVTSTNVAFGLKYGRIDNNEEIEATNVKEALTKLGEKLTRASANAKTNNVFNIVFEGEGINDLETAEFYSEADVNKLKSAMSMSRTVTEVNDASALANLPKLKTRQFKLKNDTSILQAIDDIITQSDYITKALSVIYKANLQANQNINSQKQINQDENKEVKWYSIVSEIKINYWDDNRTDYSYNITYKIQPYKTPVIRAAYIPKTTRYYGPHKRYRYYFTGQNSEIIDYRQTFNNAFFTVQAQLDPLIQGQQTATENGQTTSVPNKRQNQSRPNDPDISRETQNAYRTSLYDPASQASAKITILGDPDFLVQQTTSSVSKLYNQFYGTGYTVNVNGGQVFIEIDFNEATDYDANDNKTGLLNINDQIYLWDYPKDVKDKIKGVVYLVWKVTSTFSNGRFTQELDCVIPSLLPRRVGQERPDAATENRGPSGRSTVGSTTSVSSASQVTSPPINPTRPGPTAPNTTGVNQRTVPARSNQSIPSSTAIPGTNSNPGLISDRVRDDDGGNPPSPFQVGA